MILKENGTGDTYSNFLIRLFVFYLALRNSTNIRFKAAVVSILLYGCTTWKLTKRMEKKLDGNHTRMLRTILNKSWGQHPTKQHLYGHLPSITEAIKIRRSRNAGHCWRSKDELISDLLLWTPSHGRAKAGWRARTYILQLCIDTGCSPEDLPEAMNDREKGSGISVLMAQHNDDRYIQICKFCWMVFSTNKKC